MVRFMCFISCLVIFVSRTRSTVFEEHDGEVVLESVLHFHDGPDSIPEQNLTGLLLHISNQTAAVDQELLADPEVGRRPGAPCCV